SVHDTSSDDDGEPENVISKAVIHAVTSSDFRPQPEDQTTLFLDANHSLQCCVDSGADVSCFHSNAIPQHILESSEFRVVELQGAFGKSTVYQAAFTNSIFRCVKNQNQESRYLQQ